MARADGLEGGKRPQTKGPKVVREAGISPVLDSRLRRKRTQKAVRTPPGMTLGPLLPTGVAGGAGGAAEVAVEAGGPRAPRSCLTGVAPLGPPVSKTGVVWAVGCPEVEIGRAHV